jgi:predicted HNH restriction endonuclease
VTKDQISHTGGKRVETTKKKKSGLTDEQKIKRNFRASAAWKNFRLSFMRETGDRCSVCGVKKTGKKKRSLQLHHHDDSLENYKDISDRSKFTLLCASCHKDIERFCDRGDFEIDDFSKKLKEVYKNTIKYKKE